MLINPPLVRESAILSPCLHILFAQFELLLERSSAETRRDAAALRAIFGRSISLLVYDGSVASLVLNGLANVPRHVNRQQVRRYVLVCLKLERFNGDALAIEIEQAPLDIERAREEGSLLPPHEIFLVVLWVVAPVETHRKPAVRTNFAQAG